MPELEQRTLKAIVVCGLDSDGFGRTNSIREATTVGNSS